MLVMRVHPVSLSVHPLPSTPKPTPEPSLDSAALEVPRKLSLEVYACNLSR